MTGTFIYTAQLAVQGKLVSQDSNDESASDLFEKVRADGKRLMKEGKIKKSEPLLSVAVENMLFDLPSGWVLIKLGEIIELISGQHINAGD